MEAQMDPICVLLRRGRLPSGVKVPPLLLVTEVTDWAELMTIHDEESWGPDTEYEAEDVPTDALLMLSVL